MQIEERGENMIKNILVVFPVEEEHKEQIRQAAPAGAEVIFCAASEVTEDMVKEADVIIGNPPASMVTGSKNLKLLQLGSAGADAFIQPGVMPQQAILTNATGAYGLAISEHMLALTLELMKKLHFYRDNQSKSSWKDEGCVHSIYNATVLIVGLGDIGGEYAKRMKALGAYTIGIRRSNPKKPDYLDELYLMDRLDDMLGRADIVALSLPGTKETKGLFHAERIGKMKDGAILINVGRGSVVDTDALCDALESGKLYGAGVDVTEPEPLPADSRLWKMKNAVITPHVSGGIHLPETHNRIIRIAVDNMKRLMANEELNNIVDFTTGYRKLK
jgi:phosphoglycerate dehydrogenase-like enzyme